MMTELPHPRRSFNRDQFFASVEDVALQQLGRGKARVWTNVGGQGAVLICRGFVDTVILLA